MKSDLIAAEMAKIEAEAAHKIAQLMAHKETLLRAHELADLLKANGAPEETAANFVCYHSRPSFMIYATAESAAMTLLHAIQDTRLPYRIKPGYDDATRYIEVEGFEGIDIALPASLFPALETAAA